MVALLALVVLACVLVGAGAMDCNSNAPPKSTVLRLKQNLLCDYDKDVIPVRNKKDIVTVEVFLWLSFIRFSDGYNSLAIHCWTVWEWKDEFLTWNPADYENISGITIKEDVIWLPDIGMSNAGVVYNSKPSEQCYLSHKGELNCWYHSVYKTHCVPDLSHWPYDTQSCSMYLESWELNSGQLNLTVNASEAVSMQQFEQNSYWELLGVVHTREVATFNDLFFPAIRYEFSVRRRISSFAATVVVPALVLALLTLMTFWMNAREPQRLFVGASNVFAHCIFINYLGIMLPSNGSKCPYIVQFYRDSMLLAGLALAEAVLARGLSRSSRAAPGWLQAAQRWLMQSRPGEMFGLSYTDLAKENGGSETTGVWPMLASLMDRLCFTIFALALVVLALRFLI